MIIFHLLLFNLKMFIDLQLPPPAYLYFHSNPSFHSYKRETVIHIQNTTNQLNKNTLLNRLSIINNLNDEKINHNFTTSNFLNRT